MPIKTVFLNLNPAAAKSDQSGIINVFRCKRLKVKAAIFEGTAADKQCFMTSDLVSNECLCLFSTRPAVYQAFSEVIFDFDKPVSFQGTFNFNFFSNDGVAIALTGNIVLHLEFHLAK